MQPTRLGTSRGDRLKPGTEIAPPNTFFGISVFCRHMLMFDPSVVLNATWNA
jgi:hypothetical protein